jgi:hypothetical protein
MKKNYLKIFNIFEIHLISVKNTKVLQNKLMTIYMPFTLTTLVARYLFSKGSWGGKVGGGEGGGEGVVPERSTVEVPKGRFQRFWSVCNPGSCPFWVRANGINE